MANEATAGINLIFDNGNEYAVFGKSGLMLDVTGTTYLKGKQKVAGTEELLELGDVGVGGLCAGYNGHATAVFQIIGASAETPLVRAEPGDPFLFRIDDGATPYVISSVADAELEYLVTPA